MVHIIFPLPQPLNPVIEIEPRVFKSPWHSFYSPFSPLYPAFWITRTWVQVDYNNEFSYDPVVIVGWLSCLVKSSSES